MAYTNILEDMSVFLAAAGLGLTVATNLYGGIMPTDPDACVSIYEYTPDAPIETMGNKVLPAIEQPNLQVMVRDPDYAAGRLLAHNIWKTLRVVTKQTINGTVYVAITSKQSPFHAHSDNQRRHYFSCNYVLQRALTV